MNYYNIYTVITCVASKLSSHSLIMQKRLYHVQMSVPAVAWFRVPAHMELITVRAEVPRAHQCEERGRNRVHGLALGLGPLFTSTSEQTECRSQEERRSRLQIVNHAEATATSFIANGSTHTPMCRSQSKCSCARIAKTLVKIQ